MERYKIKSKKANKYLSLEMNGNNLELFLHSKSPLLSQTF